MSAGTQSFLGDLASSTLDWMADDPSRPDPGDEVFAFALATYADGTPITPRGFDVSMKFSAETVSTRCTECGDRLTDEPDGSTLCRRCFFRWGDEREDSLFNDILSRIARSSSSDTDRSSGGDA